MSDQNWRKTIQSIEIQLRRTTRRSLVFLHAQRKYVITVAGIVIPTFLLLWILVVGCHIRHQQSEVLRAQAVMDDRIQRLEEKVEEALVSFTARRQVIAGLLRENTIALGIRYSDTSGQQKFIWKGTGFPVWNSAWCITAAHVVEQLHSLRDDLDERGLLPQLVAMSHTGSVWLLLEERVHPDCPVDRHVGAPTLFFTDIGVVRLDVSDLSPPIGLRICQDDPLTEVGEEIAVAGFPTEVTSVGYPKTNEGPMLSTIRFGRVERLSSLDTRIGEPLQLIQHNIPLVGGFSGAPLVNLDGEVIGISTVSSYRTISAEETVMVEDGTIRRQGNIRLLDAANMNFAVSANLLQQWLSDLLPGRSAQ